MVSRAERQGSRRLNLPEAIEVAVNRDASEFGREGPKVAVREALEIGERRLDHVLSRRHDAGRYEWLTIELPEQS